MKVSMCKTMRTYEWKNLSKDLLAGLVIMAVSIPISMGMRRSRGFRRCRTVRLSFSDSTVCLIFYFPAVCFRCRCCSGGTGRIGTGKSGD